MLGQVSIQEVSVGVLHALEKTPAQVSVRAEVRFHGEGASPQKSTGFDGLHREDVV